MVSKWNPDNTPTEAIDLTIPGSVTYNGNTYQVVGTAKNQFLGTSLIKNLVIESNKDGFFLIKREAFKESTSLESVTFSSDMKELIVGYEGIGSVFYNCTKLSSITLPTSDDFIMTVTGSANFSATAITSMNFHGTVYFTHVGDNNNTFKNCTSLVSVTFDKAPAFIRPGMFNGCTALTSFIIGEKTNEEASDSIYFAQNSFEGCTSLKSVTVKAKSNLVSFGSEAFKNSGLESVTVENAPVRVGKSSFVNLSNLKYVDFKKGIVGIGFRGFAGTSSLIGNNAECGSVLTFPKADGQNEDDESTWFDEIVVDECAFTNSNVHDLQFHTLAKKYTLGFNAFQPRYSNHGMGDFLTNLNELEFTGKSLVHIGDGAFYGSSLKTLTIGDILDIEPYAFYGCNKLETVSLATKEDRDDYITLQSNTFNGCTALTTVTLDCNIDKIEKAAFNNCNKLTTITIHGKNCSDELYLGAETFKNCIALESITINEAQVRIDSGAFAVNSALKTINIPCGISYLGPRAFRNCTSLESFSAPNSTFTEIPDSCFQSCTNLTSVTIPSKVTRIGKEAFFECEKLTEMPEFPDGLTTLDWHCFRKAGLTGKLVIPESVDTIYEYAFYECKNITDVVLPKTLKTLYRQSFNYCQNLKTVTINNPIPCTLINTSSGELMFNGCTKLTDVYVPCPAVPLYTILDVWKDNPTFDGKIKAIAGTEGTISTVESDMITTAGGCDCFTKDVTISPNASLSFINYNSTDLNNALAKHNFTVERYLNIDKTWNLIGNLSDATTYDFLNTVHGNNVTTNLYDIAALEMENNDWSDYKYKDDALPTDKSSIFVWVFNANKEQNALSGDDYAVLPMTVTTLNETQTSFTVNQENNGTKNTRDPEGENVTGMWYALYNPYIGRLSAKQFLNDNADKLQGKSLYIYDETADKWKCIDKTSSEAADDDDLYPATGFMVAANESNDEGKKLTVEFKTSQIVNDNKIYNHYKSDKDNAVVEFTVKANGTVTTMKAVYNEKSSNGFDDNDAYVLFSDNNGNLVEPYFLVDKHRIYSNNFSSLPYTCPVNFHATKSGEITLSVTNNPKELQVSLIDLATGIETLFDGSITLQADEGENSGRYAVKIAKNNVSIQETETSNEYITVTAINNRITVSGKDLKHIAIYNSLGQQVVNKNISGDYYSFDFMAETGVYVIRALSGNASASEKIIVK